MAPANITIMVTVLIKHKAMTQQQAGQRCEQVMIGEAAAHESAGLQQKDRLLGHDMNVASMC